MRKKRIPWTKEEDNILIEAVKKSPYNKAKAFRAASEELLLRDYDSCSNRWYRHLSNPENPHYVKLFTTVSNNALQLENRVVSRDNTPISPKIIKETFWKRIKRILGF